MRLCFIYLLLLSVTTQLISQQISFGTKGYIEDGKCFLTALIDSTKVVGFETDVDSVLQNDHRFIIHLSKSDLFEGDVKYTLYDSSFVSLSMKRTGLTIIEDGSKRVIPDRNLRPKWIRIPIEELRAQPDTYVSNFLETQFWTDSWIEHLVGADHKLLTDFRYQGRGTYTAKATNNLCFDFEVHQDQLVFAYAKDSFLLLHFGEIIDDNSTPKFKLQKTLYFDWERQDFYLFSLGKTLHLFTEKQEHFAITTENKLLPLSPLRYPLKDMILIGDRDTQQVYSFRKEDLTLGISCNDLLDQFCR